MSGPLVSVIIPTYKQAHLLSQAVQSVLDQTYAPVEIIVVDDGSPDDVPATVASFGDQVRLIRQSNAGPSAARNTGLAAARGDCCLFLDSDDWLVTNAIERHMQVREMTKAAVTVSGWREVLPDGADVLVRQTVDVSGDIFHQLLRGNLAIVHSFVSDTAAVRAVGGFDGTLRSCEDWDVWLKLAAIGCSFAPVSGSLAIYRKAPGTVSTNHQRMYDTAEIVVRRHSQLHGRCPICREAATAAMDYWADSYFRWQVSPRLRHGPNRLKTFSDAIVRVTRRPRSLKPFVIAVGRAIAGGGL